METPPEQATPAPSVPPRDDPVTGPPPAVGEPGHDDQGDAESADVPPPADPTPSVPDDAGDAGA
jgi:hypothetical protein